MIFLYHLYYIESIFNIVISSKYPMIDLKFQSLFPPRFRRSSPFVPLGPCGGDFEKELSTLVRSAYTETEQLEKAGKKRLRDFFETSEQAGGRLVLSKLEEYLSHLGEMEELEVPYYPFGVEAAQVRDFKCSAFFRSV